MTHPRTTFPLLGALALFLVACPAAGRTERSEPAIAAASRLVRAHMERLEVPGMSVAVAREGELIWSEGFGVEDLESREPVTPRTRFRIGSVSKPLTATAAARLYEAGTLDLDRPVREYLPSFPAKEHPATARQLAGHLAGIRHYRDKAESRSNRRFSTVAASLELFAGDPLEFEPGTRYGYSSYGYQLLAAVMERAAGESFPELMERQVFGPAGLEDTGLDRGPASRAGVTAFYSADAEGARIVAPPVDLSDRWAGGGMISTAEDLVRFGSALLSGELVGDEGREALFTPQTLADGTSTGYGMGWEIREDPEGRTVYYHGGMVTGGLAHLILYPESGLVFAVLANTSESIGFNEDEAFALASLFAPGTSLVVEPSLDPTGAYVFETVWDETRWGGDREDRVGLLQIFSAGDHWEGLLTFEDWRPAKIPVVRFEGAEAELIAVPGNWIFLDLRLEEEGLSGTWVIPGPEIGGSLEGMERVFPRPSEPRGRNDR